MGKSLALGHVTFLLRNMNFYFGHDWHFCFSKCVCMHQTHQKFGLCDEINCLYTTKPIFDFMLVYIVFNQIFLPNNECPG